MSKKSLRASSNSKSKVALALTASLVVSAAIVFLTTILILEQLGSIWPMGRVIIVSTLFFGSGSLFLLFAYGSARKKIWGYAGAVASTAVFILITYSDLTRILSTTSDPNFYRSLAFIFASVVNISLGAWAIRTSRRLIAPSI
ncbi:MAG TPA: hypothetical protein VGQ03_04670 [Nitrososphaera sp.]|jgi:hypothetical protein|nr:hypothetical protein [Nitrososphaera sp.]